MRTKRYAVDVGSNMIVGLDTLSNVPVTLAGDVDC